MDQGGGFERGPKVCGGVSLSTRDVQKPLFLKGANDAEEKQKKKNTFSSSFVLFLHKCSVNSCILLAFADVIDCKRNRQTNKILLYPERTAPI